MVYLILGVVGIVGLLVFVGWIVSIFQTDDVHEYEADADNDAEIDDDELLNSRHDLPPSLWESDMWPPPEHAIDHGGGLSFTYADANGEVSERRIISWKEDPEYDHCFTGWCTDREEPRTFRIDRVQSWG
jgi:hypothetical protein